MHPLEISGRASQSFNGLKFTSIDLCKIYIAHHYLKTYYENEIYIQLDLLHKDNTIDNPNFLFHQSFKPQLTCESFSSIFKELIINDNGDIFPIAYGCSPFIKIGNINSARKLSEITEWFMEEKIGHIIRLFNDTYFKIVNDKDFEIFNWSERVIENSYIFEYEQPCDINDEKEESYLMPMG